jgi:hypothetical protein
MRTVAENDAVALKLNRVFHRQPPAIAANAIPAANDTNISDKT